MMEQVAGRGRKLCSGCNTFVGARTQLCSCGHNFGPSEKKIATEVFKPGVTSQAITEKVPFSTTILVAIPAGACPKALPAELSQETVLCWIDSIQEPFTKLNQKLMPSAIRYFARTLFNDIRSKKLQQVERILDKILISEDSEDGE